MTRVATIFETPLLRVQQLDHPRNEVHVDGSLEQAREYSVTFLRSGEFRIVRRSGEWDFGPGDVLVSTPGVLQRAFHPQGAARDECVSIRFGEALLEDALGKLPIETSFPKTAFSARTAFQRWLLEDALRSRDRMMIEGVALAAAQSFMPLTGKALPWNAIERSYGWYSRRVQRVCRLLVEDYDGNHSLTCLAKVAGMSPFHLDRVFHYMMGMPLHQYVVRLRTAAAARDIRQGRSITEAAFAAGFNSLGFFSRSFRKHYGVAPREYRKARMSVSGSGHLAVR